MPMDKNEEAAWELNHSVQEKRQKDPSIKSCKGSSDSREDRRDFTKKGLR